MAKTLADYVTEKGVLNALQELIDIGIAELIHRDDGEPLFRMFYDSDGTPFATPITMRITNTGLQRLE
jgi:hypothetical protein